MKKNIPNFITLGNLFCGCIAIAHHSLEWSCFFIFLAAVLDFFDGLVARLLNVTSPLGKQLDSLADVVSFGVAPAFLLHQTLLLETSIDFSYTLLPFLLAVGGAWRLARFNIDETQSEHFKGLPIPANGIFWIGFLLLNRQWLAVEEAKLPIIICLVLAMTFLMVSTIPLLSFKIKKLTWKGNEARMIILIGSAIILALCGILENIFLSIPSIILLYTITSILYFLKKRTHEV